jgi:hypothetical protein
MLSKMVIIPREKPIIENLNAFECAHRKIVFSGTASGKELINGVINSVKDLAHEPGLLAVLIDNS